MTFQPGRLNPLEQHMFISTLTSKNFVQNQTTASHWAASPLETFWADALTFGAFCISALVPEVGVEEVCISPLFPPSWHL